MMHSRNSLWFRTITEPLPFRSTNHPGQRNDWLDLNRFRECFTQEITQPTSIAFGLLQSLCLSPSRKVKRIPIKPHFVKFRVVSLSFSLCLRLDREYTRRGNHHMIDIPVPAGKIVENKTAIP